MGALSRTAIAVILAFFIVGMFSGALYDSSPDPDKEEFSGYSQKRDKSEMDFQNVSAQNTENPESNFEEISNNILQSINNARRDLLESGDIGTQILGAFGLATSLVINVLHLMILVIFETVNFVTGIGTNIYNLDPTWMPLMSVATVGVVITLVYLTFKLASAHIKQDL